MRVSGLSGGVGLSSLDVSATRGGGGWLPDVSVWVVACGGCAAGGGVVCCWVGGC